MKGAKQDRHANAIFALCGQIWVARFGGVQTLLKDSVGLRYIYHLLQRPATLAHVTDLIAWVHGVNPDIIDKVHSDGADALDNDGMVTDTLSEEGREHLMNILQDRKLELITVRGSASPLRIEEMEAEIEQIEKYLKKHAHATLAPKLPSRADRDRKSVTNAIHRAVKKIEPAHPSLSEHLKYCIETGYECAYYPHPVVEWSFVMPRLA